MAFIPQDKPRWKTPQNRAWQSEKKVKMPGKLKRATEKFFSSLWVTNKGGNIR